MCRDETQTKDFVNSLKKVGPSLGMAIGSPKVFPITDNKPSTYVSALNQVSSVFVKSFNSTSLYQAIAGKPSIVMVIIPNNKVSLLVSRSVLTDCLMQGEHYSAIKKVACVENPIPSQCITSTVLK